VIPSPLPMALSRGRPRWQRPAPAAPGTTGRWDRASPPRRQPAWISN